MHRTQLRRNNGENSAVTFLPFEVDVRHASGLFTIQDELEDLPSCLG